MRYSSHVFLKEKIVIKPKEMSFKGILLLFEPVLFRVEVTGKYLSLNGEINKFEHTFLQRKYCF